jgi:tRNA-dihydrouridine synthase
MATMSGISALRDLCREFGAAHAYFVSKNTASAHYYHQRRTLMADFGVDDMVFSD